MYDPLRVKNLRGVAFGRWLPVVVIVCYGILALLPDLRQAVPEMLTVTAIITVCLVLILFAAEKGRFTWSPAAILFMAACLRLLFLSHSPQLSDDIQRYLFDGSRLSGGHNPYSASPETAVMETPETARLAADVNHPNLVTIYPPAAQVLFAAGAVTGGITGVKLVFIVIDLILIGLMMRLLSRLGLPLQRAVLYAWHPLSVLEIASSGHVDGAGLLFVFAAILLLLPGPDPKAEAPPLSRNIAACRQDRLSVFWSGFLFSAAVLIKLFPIVLIPLCGYLVRRLRRRHFVIGFFAGSILLLVPFYPDILNITSTLKVYAVTWEFSGLLFQGLRDLLCSGDAARIGLGIAFGVFLLYCYRRPRRHPATAYSAEAAFSEALKSCYLIGFGFLLFTPTLHPWYALYMLVFLPFSPEPPGLILSWSVTLGYRVLIPFYLSGHWVEGGSVPILIWSGPAAAAIFLIRRRKPVKD